MKRLRRWWMRNIVIGPDLYDLASVAVARDPEAEGRARAMATLRRIDAEDRASGGPGLRYIRDGE